MKLSLVFAFVLFSLGAGAQQSSASKGPAVRLGNIEGTKTTIAAILATPQLTCTDNNCQVTEFQISFLPQGGEFWGPYTVKGSNKIPEAQLALLGKWKGTPVRVFIEGVKQSCGGKTLLSNPVILKCSE